MRSKILPRIAVIGAALAITASSSNAQDDSALSQLSDPAFWRMVESGPSNDEELERLVTTYAANDMPEQASEALRGYLLSSLNGEHAQCVYCMSLLALVQTPKEDELVDLLFQAMDAIFEESHQQSSGDDIVLLAQMVARSKNRANWNRAFYYMANAVPLGIDDELKMTVVHFLAEVGRYADARELAAALFENEDSVYHQSDDVQRWIEWLEKEIERNDRLGSMLVAIGDRH
jgi:hypothetical protein